MTSYADSWAVLPGVPDPRLSGEGMAHHRMTPMVPSPPDDLDALAAADPTALDFTLERIAVSRVDLWPVLAANPSTPETVLGVMRSYGSAQVQEILAHRQTPTAGSRSSLRQVATDSQGPLGVVEGGPLGAVGDQDDWDLSNGVRLLPPVPIYSWGSQPSQPPQAAGGRR